MEIKDFYDSEAALQMAEAYKQTPVKRHGDLLLLFVLLFNILEI